MKLPTFLRPLLLTILLAHLLMLVAGAACGAELPPDAAKLVASFDADAAKLRADAEAAVEKKAAVLANALQLVQEKLTKKGDLDGAMAVKAKIGTLGVKKAEKPVDQQRELIATWSISGTDYTITALPNRTALWKGPRQSFPGSWTWDAKANALRISWNNGSYESLHYVDHNNIECHEETSEGVQTKSKAGTRVEVEAGK